MVESCKYKGGGLEKIEEGMYYFTNNAKSEMSKGGLDSNKNTMKKLGPIKILR